MPSQATPQRRSFLAPLVIVAVAAAAAVALVITFARPSARAPDAARPGTGAAQASATPPSDAVTLKVRTSPAGAKILLDGVLLGAGSYEGKVARSETPKVLRVEAEGHTPKEEPVTLASDLIMNVSLDKDPAASAEPSSSSKPVGPGPGPRPRQTATTTSTSGRGIDIDSPYGNRP